MSYCPSYAGSYPSISCGPCCPPPYPPCPPQSHCSSICGISKLASFVHYGGNSGNCCGAPPPPKRDQCCQPKQQRPQQQQCQSQNRGGPLRRCPPIPPCAATCMTQGQDCKDLPAQRLRNVDVLEELCYYVPGGDPSCQMDCYCVDECGNVEKIGEGGGGDGCCDPCNNNSDPCGCPPNPVKYSRRQRFTFNDPKGTRSSYGDPWPFEGICGDGGGGNGNYPGRGYNNGNNRGNGVSTNGPGENLCCNARANGNSNGYANGNGRQYTYCPEGTVDCGDMLPPESGVYYYDRERRAFVPERELPKAPEVIEKRITVPDVEEYEILEEEDGSEGGMGGGGGGGRNCPPPPRPTIQPVVQPIIMSTGSNPQPCNPPPPQIIPYPIPTPYNPCPCPPPCCPPPQPPPPPPPPPPCNPCNSCSPCCGPCQPCAPMCNPCYNPCYNQCNPGCNPCMPCGPMNPFMNMCGGCLPMVIPMCPQQPSGGGGGYNVPPPGAMPPPPFPFPPPFFKEKKKKKKKRRESRSESRYYPESGTQYSDNIIVPGAPEEMLDEMDEEIPPEAQAVELGSDIEVEEGLPPIQEPEPELDAEAPLPPKLSIRPRQEDYGGGGGGRNVQRLDDGTIITTIDFPPGEAEIVDVTATARRNPYEPNIDVVAELQGGKAGPGPPGQMLSPNVQYTTEDGATVTSYNLPEGKDGYVKATSNTDLQ